MKKALTLTEMTIVIVIIGILVTLAISYFGPSKENLADKEATSNLKVIRAAEKSYYIDTIINYYPSSGSVSDIVAINQNLKLCLPSDSQRNWNYEVWNTGCARATRNVSVEDYRYRSWYLNISDADNQPNSGKGEGEGCGVPPPPP